MNRLQCVFEALDDLAARTFKGPVRLVVGNQIDLRLRVSGDACKLLRLKLGVVDPGEQHIFKGQKAAGGFAVKFAGLKNFFNVATVFGRDQQGSGFIVGSNGARLQIPLFLRVPEIAEFPASTAGRNRHAPLRNGDAIGSRSFSSARIRLS